MFDVGPVLLARLLLAAVFVVAGWAKVADFSGTRRSMVDFGVPTMLASTSSVLVIAAELSCASLLVPVRSAWWGAAGSAVFLITFLSAMAANVLLGRRPDCRCFGQIHASPIGWRTAVRNLVLLGMAVFVIAREPGSAAPDIAIAGNAVRVGGLVIPMWAIALFTAWVLAAFWMSWTMRGDTPASHQPAVDVSPDGAVAPQSPRQPVAPGLEGGLPLDAPAPAFALSSLSGDVVALDAFLATGKLLLLLFSRPNCPSCDSVLSDAGRWQREHAGHLLVVAISNHGFDVNREKAARHGLQDMLIQRGDEVAEAYGVQSVPSAVLVRDGRIASPLVEGRDAIRALVANAVSGPR